MRSVTACTGARRAAVSAAVAAGWLLVTAALWWGSADAAAATTSGPATFADLVAATAAGVAWLAATWLTAGLLLTVAASGPHCAGGALHRLAARVTPAVLHRAVSVLLGAAVAGTSVAAAAPAGAAGAVAAAPALPAAGGVPSLDRPAATVPATDGASGLDGRVAPRSSARPPAPDSSAPRAAAPGWSARRPAAPRAAVGGAGVRLVTAAPHAVHAVPDEVVVRRGDTLWDLAARSLGSTATAADVAREWPRWYAANRAVIGPDPDLLLPGQVLVPPPRR